MAYRGHDLDLRLGRNALSRGTQPAAGESSGLGVGGEPASRPAILVDDTLMTTCNHAYEAAVFYGSRDVRLDHLVYALTRVAGAAHVLDDLGIRPERLRKEAALAIAAETPAAPADAKTDPETSEEFETTLRRAAEHANDRGALAGIVDVVRVILGAGRENATVALLTRASSDPQRLERWREENRRREPSLTEVLRAAQTPDLNPAIMARLDTLEAALKMIGTESNAERRSTHDMLRQVHDALQVLSEPKTHALLERTDIKTHALLERTDELKGAIDSRLGDLSDLILALDDRVHGIAKTRELPIDDVNARFDKIEQKFEEHSNELSRAVTPALSERVGQVVTERLEQLSERIGQAADRLGNTESAVSQLLGSAQQTAPSLPPELMEKIGQLDVAVRAQLTSAEELAKTHERDLSEIYEALVKLGSNQQTLANNLNTWRLDTSGDVSIVSNRLEALETTVLESLGRISAELQMLRGSSDEQPARMGGFKRWLYGTNRVLSPEWNDRPGPLRQALARVRLVKRP